MFQTRILSAGVLSLSSCHLDADGATMFEHACRFSCEGIVRKRVDQPYSSGRSKGWLKIKNPNSPAAVRLEERTF